MTSITTIPKRIFLLISIFSLTFLSKAQVLTQDSLALVALYNSTDGNNWVLKTNWLNTNVGSWFGISLSGNRVTKIQLPSNNLLGDIPASFSQLDSLKKINLNNNGLTAFPTVTNLVSIDTLDLRNNKLTFKDIKYNVGVAAKFLYTPQDKVDNRIDTIVVEQNNIVLTTTIDTAAGLNDKFQWLKNGDTLVGATTRNFTILCMDSAQSGNYTVLITNSSVAGLTLTRRTINVIFQRLANAGSDISICSASSTLNALPTFGYQGTWTVAAGSAVVTNDTLFNSTITNMAVGNNVFKWTVMGNALCAASYDFVTITRDANPSLANAGWDKSVCRDSVFLLAAPATVGTGVWTVTKGASTVAQPSKFNSSVSNLSFGENIFRWQIYNGSCPPSVFDEVKVYRDDTLVTADAGVDSSICFTDYILSAQLSPNTSGIWTLVSGGGTITDTAAMVTSVSGLIEGPNIFRWKVSNTCNAVSDNVNITVYNFTKANAGADKEIYYSPLFAYPLAGQTPVGTGGNGAYAYVWNPSSNLDDATKQHPNFLTPEIGTYTFDVLVTDGHGCTAQDTVVYTVVQSKVLDVPTLFTPNGDGVNDEFYIPGIESYPDNELTVVDRNGQIVYKRAGYTNDWQGTHEDGFNAAGKPLSADTYYYTLRLNDSNTQRGFFLIKK